MDKKIWLGASLVGIVILHACTFSSTNPSSSLTNSANLPGQKKANPEFSGVTFAGIQTNLIEPIDKQQRQAVLDQAINSVANADRDPFAAIPGTFALPPATVYVPVPQPPEQTPAPSVAARPVFTPQPSVPPVPTPLEAEQIKVTGAMEIGGKSYAIVTVPGGASSQYVTEGERLAGSKVLVKSIDLSDRAQVVLQQNNAEFTHTVDQS